MRGRHNGWRIFAKEMGGYSVLAWAKRAVTMVSHMENQQNSEPAHDLSACDAASSARISTCTAQRQRTQRANLVLERKALADVPEAPDARQDHGNVGADVVLKQD